VETAEALSDILGPSFPSAGYNLKPMSGEYRSIRATPRGGGTVAYHRERQSTMQQIAEALSVGESVPLRRAAYGGNQNISGPAPRTAERLGAILAVMAALR
jgi:hypothetical protein